MLVFHIQCVSLGHTNTGCLTHTLPLKIIVKMKSSGLNFPRSLICIFILLTLQINDLENKADGCSPEHLPQETHISNTDQELHGWISNEKLNSINQIPLVLTSVKKFKMVQTGLNRTEPVQFRTNWFRSVETILNQIWPFLTASDRFQPVWNSSNVFKMVLIWSNRFYRFWPDPDPISLDHIQPVLNGLIIQFQPDPISLNRFWPDPTIQTSVNWFKWAWTGLNKIKIMNKGSILGLNADLWRCWSPHHLPHAVPSPQYQTPQRSNSSRGPGPDPVTVTIFATTRGFSLHTEKLPEYNDCNNVEIKQNSCDSSFREHNKWQLHLKMIS